jgi:hypothetical protein
LETIDPSNQEKTLSDLIMDGHLVLAEKVHLHEINQSNFLQLPFDSLIACIIQ